MSKNMLACVPPTETGALWHVARVMLERAYSEVDEVMPDDIEAGLASGKLLLWVSVDEGEIVACLITALTKRPSGLVCQLVACAGVGIVDWIDGRERIESYARAEGCDKVCAMGRPGWARMLHGYKVKRVELEKVL